MSAAQMSQRGPDPALLQTSPSHPVWLRVGTLLDGTSTTPHRDAHLVYDASGIRFVGAHGQLPPREIVRPGQTAPDVHAPGHTLLPGLIEAHAHLFLEGGELNLEKRAAYLKQTPAELLAAACTRLEPLVRLGIAGIRDAGDKDGVGLALSKAYQVRHVSDLTKGVSPALASSPSVAPVGQVSDLTPGGSPTRAIALPSSRPLMPYLDSPGAAIHHAGRYGSFMGDPLEAFPNPRACVEARVRAGADRIKLIPTGIINFKKGAVTTEPQMTTEELAACVAAAREFKRQTFAHASGDAGIERVVESGVDSVEHGFFIRDDQLVRMRDRQIAWVPTFAPVQEQVDHADLMGWDATVVANLQRILDQHAASLVRAHAMGVLIVAGSDAGSVGVAHGLGLLRELELMEHAGLPAIAVLNAATGVSARRFAYKDDLGRIAVGARSRFILTGHSPLTTVANLRQPRLVVFDGTVYETGDHSKFENM